MVGEDDEEGEEDEEQPIAISMNKPKITRLMITILNEGTTTSA